MLRIRPLWESLYAAGRYTLFQNFEMNLLAADRFAEREEPYVVLALAGPKMSIKFPIYLLLIEGKERTNFFKF